MVLLDRYLLICSKKKFKRLYLSSLYTDSEDFAKYERARCVRHLSLYSIITLHKGEDKNEWGKARQDYR